MQQYCSHSAPLSALLKPFSKSLRQRAERALYPDYVMCYNSLLLQPPPLITTSCKLGGPILPLRCEPQGFGLPAGRTTDDNQAPCFKRLQTMTDVALVTWQGPHQVLMTARDHAVGAPVVRC